MEQHYRELGLSPGASEEEIKQAFNQAAQERHPDRPGGSEEAFIKARAAKDALLRIRREEANRFQKQAAAQRTNRGLGLALGVLVAFGFGAPALGGVEPRKVLRATWGGSRST